MASIYDVEQNALIEKAAESLKKVPEMEAPKWAPFVKTGTFKDRPPLSDDWWFMRSASILRRVARMGPIGVAKLRTLYGGKKNRGVRPEKFFKGSGSILRKSLQGLEKAGLVKQYEKAGHKGRVLTPKGASLLDKAATEVQKETPKEVVPKGISAIAPKVEVKAAPKVEAPKPEAKEAPKAEGKPEVKVAPKPEAKEAPKKE